MYFSPRIVTSGLRLTLDAADKNSYPGSGTSWIDLSGNNNTSTFVGGPTFSNINKGTIYFDGVSAYCGITPSNNFLWTPSGIGLNNMTIDLWIKTSDINGAHYTISKPWNSSGEYNYGINYNTYFNMRVGTQSNSFNFGNIATGTWKNLVILVSSTQFGSYINGSQTVALTNHGITNNTPDYGNGGESLTLMTLYPYGGGGSSLYSTPGNIGSFRIYNRVLSASEISQNYNATKTRFGL